ncbi:MAG: chemotaxis response regulator protein-glutamate methylesterase [Dehalococcoidia bacterium]|nr:chemotaxis response regulator protein-glutamate methylesterase [Dehalococcoidia bacterium]
MGQPELKPDKQIRVLIADDSAFMRRALQRLLEKAPGVVVVDTASDGVEAVRKALELRPDVITMDVEMPRMDGIRAVEEIMHVVPTPIVMVSTLTAEGADTAIRALEAGAVECVGKPGALSAELINVENQLAEAVLRASEARVQQRRQRLQFAGQGTAQAAGKSPRVIVICSSTGGPPALSQVVPRLPANLGAAVIVVQHMPSGFTSALARRLDAISPLAVSEAEEGDTVAVGRVLIAPGGFHLTVGPDHRIHLNDAPTLHGVRPAADITLASIASVYGGNATVAVLTGMGRDGADGAARIEALGGTILVQDEASCVVYGMPKSTREHTRNPHEIPLDHMAEALIRAVA